MSLTSNIVNLFINKAYQKILDLAVEIGDQSYIDGRFVNSLNLATELQDCIDIFNFPNELTNEQKIYLVDKLSAKACLNDYNYTLFSNRFVTFLYNPGNGGSSTAICCEYKRNVGSKFKIGGLNIGFIPTSMEATFDEMLYGNIPPSIALVANPSIVEKAKPNLTISLTYNITLNDGLVVSRTLKRNSSVINSPIVNLGSFNDVAQIFQAATNYSFLVTYSNFGPQSVVSTVRHYAPTFYGCLSDAVNTIVSQIEDLPRSIVAPQDFVNLRFSPASQKYVFAEPQSVGIRNRILDQNGSQVYFFILSTFNLTLLDTVTIEPYYLYVSPSLVSLPVGTSSVGFSFFRN